MPTVTKQSHFLNIEIVERKEKILFLFNVLEVSNTQVTYLQTHKKMMQKYNLHENHK